MVGNSRKRQASPETEESLEAQALQVQAKSANKKAKTTKKKDKESPEPSAKVNIHLNRYHMLYDEMAEPGSLWMTELNFDKMDGTYELLAGFQNAGNKCKAVIGPGRGILMTLKARTRIQIKRRPLLDEVEKGWVTINSKGDQIQLYGTSYMPIIFREGMTGVDVMCRLKVHIVYDGQMPHDLLIGEDTPAFKKTGEKANFEKKQIEIDMWFPNEEAVIICGPLAGPLAGPPAGPPAA